jgi:hypothetical protein
MYVIVITDAKADLDNFNLEKHHQLTRDRMLQKMKNAAATEPVRLTSDSHPALQDELSGAQNNESRFSSYDRGRRRPFSTDSCLDAQVGLGRTESIVTLSYRNVSQ